MQARLLGPNSMAGPTCLRGFMQSGSLHVIPWEDAVHVGGSDDDKIGAQEVP